MLHNTFSGDKYRHDDIRYSNTKFHGNKQTLKVIKLHIKGHIINRIFHS